MMAKVVYNACYGGFSLSPAAVKLGKSLSPAPDWESVDKYGYFEGPRHDPVLVQVVEQLGTAANGNHAKLKIAEVASGVGYRIDEYDGSETVMTNDDYQWTVAP